MNWRSEIRARRREQESAGGKRHGIVGFARVEIGY